VLGEEIDSRAKSLTLRGLGVRIFGEDEACIKCGAAFAYDSEMVSQIIELHKVFF
jgi:hypothetical protein